MFLQHKTPCEAEPAHGSLAPVDCSKSARRWTLIAAILGSSMAFIDGTAVNVALPSIQRQLDASASDMQWVVEAYALFLSALLLVGGALGDRYGRRKIFMVGVALFTLASIGCGLSGSALQLIVTRAVQGIGAALLVPGSLSLISTAFPDKERGAAIGTWSAFSGITTAIGPVLGGYLVDHFSWTWAFYLNAPTGLVLLVICSKMVPESERLGKAQPVDWWGALLATLGLAGVVFSLIEAPSQGWSSTLVVATGLGGAMSLAGFLAVEWRIKYPMLPLDLFRNRDFAGANLLTFLLYAAIGGGLYFVPLNLIQVQGYSATAAGAALLPFVVIIFVLSRWAGTLVDKFGPKLPLVAGTGIAALGFALFALPSVGGSYWVNFFPAACALGLGVTIAVPPLTATAMNSVGTDLAGTASGINNALARGAGLLAVAVFGIVLAWSFNANLEGHLKQSQATPAEVTAITSQRSKLAGLDIPKTMSEQAQQESKLAVGKSFVSGFRWVMLISAVLALLSSATAWLFISGRPISDVRSAKGS